MVVWREQPLGKILEKIGHLDYDVEILSKAKPSLNHIDFWTYYWTNQVGTPYLQYNTEQEAINGIAIELAKVKYRLAKLRDIIK